MTLRDYPDKIRTLAGKLLVFGVTPMNAMWLASGVTVALDETLTGAQFASIFIRLGILYCPFGPSYATALALILVEYLNLHETHLFSFSVMLTDFSRQFQLLLTDQDIHPTLDRDAPDYMMDFLMQSLSPSIRPGGMLSLVNAKMEERLTTSSSGSISSISNASTASSSQRATQRKNQGVDGSQAAMTKAVITARELTGAKVPSLRPQPGLARDGCSQPTPNSYVCFRWIKEGCSPGGCSVSNCWRFHQFHPDEPA